MIQKSRDKLKLGTTGIEKMHEPGVLLLRLRRHETEGPFVKSD